MTFKIAKSYIAGFYGPQLEGEGSKLVAGLVWRGGDGQRIEEVAQRAALR